MSWCCVWLCCSCLCCVVGVVVDGVGGSCAVFVLVMSVYTGCGV